MEYQKVDNPQRFPYFPKGKYEAEVVSYEDNVLSKSNNLQVKLTLKIYGDERTSIPELRKFDYLPNTANMAWKLKSFMEAVGQVYGDPLDLDKSVGKLFFVILDEQPYQGEIQNSVQGYLPYVKEEVPVDGANVPDSDLPF